MLRIDVQNSFKKDYKKAVARGLKPELLKEVVELLAAEKPLPKKYRDHALRNSRNYKNMRECHIQPDWLLIYYVNQDKLVLTLVRTGAHSDLFE